MPPSQKVAAAYASAQPDPKAEPKGKEPIPAYDLIVTQEWLPLYQRYKDLAMNEPEPFTRRNQDPGRYISNTFGNPPLPRDFPPGEDRGYWAEEDGYEHTDLRIIDQPGMVYYNSRYFQMDDQSRVAATLYHSLTLKRPSDADAGDTRTYPHYDTTKDTRLPIHVRLDDSYLVACLLDFPPDHLNDNFPTDFAPDGEPYTDRPRIGMPACPRGAYKDYPHNGVFVLDRRLAVIFVTIGNLSLPYICGGEGFDAGKVSDVRWKNFHQHFIDITGKARDDLLPVLDEPVEVERRRLQPAQVLPTQLSQFQPPGTTSKFNQALGKIRPAVTYINNSKRKGTVPRAMSERVLSNHPTRGYLPDRPDFELIAHAAASSSAYHNSHWALDTYISADMEDHNDLMMDIEELLNGVANWNTTTGSQLPKDFLSSFEKLGIAFRRKLADNFSGIHYARSVIANRLDGIPAADLILEALPQTVYSNDQRSVVAASVDPIVAFNIYDAPPLWVSRTSLEPTIQVPPANLAWSIPITQLSLYPRPYAHNETATHQLLFSALKVHDMDDSSTPNKRAPDNSADTSSSKRRKGIHGRGNYHSSAGTTSSPAAKEEKEDEEDLGVAKPGNDAKSGQFLPTGKRWLLIDPPGGGQANKKFYREMSKLWEVKRHEKYEDIISDIVGKVVHKGWAYTQAGRKYGIIEDATPTKSTKKKKS
ncbi:uncharacterized protein RCO7_06259 [Rhynchosporium graminicola]|uniref:Uncharacterized protein n=1 Tax=Rhynchosporium graminicola TaxID=2792576 RepID=A0A1E1KWF1_9HELO|nr:uncharacterized protein RCO7_06259 [Rhynchosporium commune]